MIWMYLLLVFVVVLVLIRIIFREEISATFDRDPAARSSIEIMLTYSGLHALIGHRMAHTLHNLKVPFLPRMIMSWVRWLTGIEIHPAAKIGRRFFVDHGMGVVIGETTVIGNDVTLFQGVTLGGTGKEQGKRHPTLGNNIVVGAGSKVLGNITIGDHSMIGANAVVIRSVPKHSTVVGVPGRVAKIKDKHFKGINLEHSLLPDPLVGRLEHLQHEIDMIENQMTHFHDEPEHSHEEKTEGNKS